MKKLPIVLFFLMLGSSLFGQREVQRLTIEHHQELSLLLKKITDQSGWFFSYNPDVIDPDQLVTLHIKDAKITEVLDTLSHKLKLRYSLMGNQVILNRIDKNTGDIQSEETKFVVSGYVMDSLTGENLIGAAVVLQGTTIGTQTNAFGYYALELPRGVQRIEYAYLGYQRVLIDVHLSQDTRVDVALSSMVVELPDVVIDKSRSSAQDHDPESMMVRPEILQKLPEFGGEQGLIRSLQAFPGIKTHSDGSAFFFVRGGAKDQNLIMIDDAPIYNPAHLFGFYSLVVPEFTRSITVYKSDIPTHIGDRLSSIIDVRTKDGNLKSLGISGGLNPLVYQLAVEGPIVKEKSSFFASYRRSNFKWIYQAALPNLSLFFDDFHLKWNYKINKNNRLYFTLIAGTDQLNNQGDLSDERVGIQWENVAMTLRWNHIYGPKLFSNTVLYTGNYQYRLASQSDVWQSGIGKLGLKSDFTWYHSPVWTTRFGIEIQSYFFNPGKLNDGGPLASIFPKSGLFQTAQNVLYLQSVYDFDPKWRLRLGIRASSWTNLAPASYYRFSADGQPTDTMTARRGAYHTYARADPRFSISYSSSDNSLWKFSAGVYHQFIQLISNSTSPFSSFEVWLPASPNIQPQRAIQFSLGHSYKTSDRLWSLSTALYYKKMTHQIDYRPHPKLLLNPLIEGELLYGSLEAYGLEILCKKNAGRLSGWISYNYSRAIRQTPQVNRGEAYPAFQDRPHELSLLLDYSWTKRIKLSTYWTVYTGSAFSSPTSFYSFNGQVIPVFGQKNNDRLPDYKRLDIALRFVLNKNPNNSYKHSLSISVYNVLAHKNVIDVNFNKSISEDGTPVIRSNILSNQQLITVQTDLIRFLPSISYRFEL